MDQREKCDIIKGTRVGGRERGRTKPDCWKARGRARAPAPTIKLNANINPDNGEYLIPDPSVPTIGPRSDSLNYGQPNFVGHRIDRKLA